MREACHAMVARNSPLMSAVSHAAPRQCLCENVSVDKQYGMAVVLPFSQHIPAAYPLA